MRILRLVALLIVFGWIGLTKAQVHVNDYAIGKRITFQSQVLDESRDLLIHLPPGYTTTTQRYPVLYLLDGETHFVHACGSVDILTNSGIIPPIIIVGIVNRNRNRDFTPVEVKRIPNSGQYNKFCRFIRQEVFPYIETTYRTEPYRILEGHSLGGMFSIHNLFSEPWMFQAHLAISPALGYADGYVVNNLISQSPHKLVFNNHLLAVSVGDEPGYYPLIDSLSAIIQNRQPQKLDYRYQHYSGETHGSVPVVSLYDGLKWVFKGWSIPDSIAEQGLPAIKQYHQSQFTERLGLSAAIPEPILNRIGYQLIGNNKLQSALDVFAYNIELYPGSANVYDSYGEGLEQAGRLKEALDNYRKAVSVGEINHDPNLPIYRQHQEALKIKKGLKE
ncbi:MAG: hypothetical protein KBA26_12985 [Candidatus Delongbacteria bacterium]|nr:hypothetical protein [Candidatus Delongbacteria bacterium]